MNDLKLQEQAIISPYESKEFLLSPLGQDIKRFELMQRKAMMFCSSTIVPKHYQGQENVGNCIIALDMAERIGANPVLVMQNLYIVHGNPSFSSKFLIATVNHCGRFTPLRYEFKGKEGTPEWACRCYAYEKHDEEKKEPLYGDWISMDMAKKEGWSTKQGSKWNTMPGQMLRYRAAAFWQRVYAPEISMGLISEEEARDIVDIPYEEIQEKHIGFNDAPQDAKEEPKQPEPKQPDAPKTQEELFGK